jgi:hypothetical protein
VRRKVALLLSICWRGRIEKIKRICASEKPSEKGELRGQEIHVKLVKRR